MILVFCLHKRWGRSPGLSRFTLNAALQGLRGEREEEREREREKKRVELCCCPWIEGISGALSPHSVVEAANLTPDLLTAIAILQRPSEVSGYKLFKTTLQQRRWTLPPSSTDGVSPCTRLHTRRAFTPLCISLAGMQPAGLPELRMQLERS